MRAKLLLFLFAIILAGCDGNTPAQMSVYEGTTYIGPPPASNPPANPTILPSGVLYISPGATDPSATATDPTAPYPACSTLQATYVQSVLTYRVYCIRPAACASMAESFVPSCAYTPIYTVVSGIYVKIYGCTASNCPPGQNPQPGAVSTIYNGILNNNTFQTIIRICLTMFMVLYGLGIMTGMANPTPHDFTMRLVKFTVIAVFTTSATGWQYFFQYVANFFLTGTEYLIIKMVNAFSPVGPSPCASSDTSVVGTSMLTIDQFVSRFFTMKFWRLPFALFTTGWSTGNVKGVLVCFLLLIAVLIYVVAMLHAVFLYIVALVARALLFSIAPIFLIFLLFHHTREMFMGWLKQVINFSLQPVFIFAFLAFFNGMIISLLIGNGGQSGLLNGPQYVVCYYELFEANFVTAIGNAMYTFLNTGLSLILTPPGVAGTVAGTAISAAITTIMSALSFIFNPIVQLGNGLLNSLGWAPIYTWNWWQLFNVVPNHTPGFFQDAAGFVQGGILWDTTSLYKDAVASPPTATSAQSLTLLNQGNLMTSVPFSISSFMIVIMLSVLMYKMTSWAEKLAGQFSEGLTSLPYNSSAFGTLGTAAKMTVAAGAYAGGTVQSTAQRLLGMGGGATVKRATIEDYKARGLIDPKDKV